MVKTVVAIAGHAHSGKTTVGRFMQTELGFEVVEGSETIRDKALERYGKAIKSRGAYEAAFVLLQRELGADWLAKDILSSDHDRVAQIGLQSPADMRTIQTVGGLIIGLAAPAEVRYSQIKSGGPKMFPTLAHLRQFEERERLNTAETGSHTEEVLQFADYIVNASKPIDEVCARVGSLVSTFIEDSKSSQHV